MQGYVLAFRPATGDGTIVTDSGEAVRFKGVRGEDDLHGGDIVTFHLRTNDRPGAAACDIEVVQGGADRLKGAHLPLLKELYATLQMDEPVH